MDETMRSLMRHGQERREENFLSHLQGEHSSEGNRVNKILGSYSEVFLFFFV